MYERTRTTLPTDRLRIAAVVALCVLATGLPVAPVVAEEETPPPPPDAYYGEVTIDGEPAPPGTVIEAQIDGETRGSIVIDEAGVYGDESGTSEKLTVDGAEGDAGANVTVLVNGVPAETEPATVEWESAGHQRVDIAAGPEAAEPPAPGLPPGPPEPGEPNITVTGAELEADQIAVGGEAEVTATVENLGDAGSLAALQLRVDGISVNSTVVSLEAGEETTLTFTRTFDEAGEYDIAVEDVEAGTLTVGSAAVSVTDARLSETEVEPGDAVTVTGTVANDGTLEAEATVELLIDGEAVDSTSVSVDGGASTAVAFEHTFEDEGEYSVALNDASAGTVTVSDGDDGGDGLPGFGIVAAAIALLTVAAANRRTRDELA